MDKKKLALEEYEDWNWLFAFEHEDADGEYKNGTFFGVAGVFLYNKQRGMWRWPRTLRKVYPWLDIDLFVAGWEYAKGWAGDNVADNILTHWTGGEDRGEEWDE